MKRYPVAPAEQLRKAKKMRPEKFSIELGYSARAYPSAVKNGYLSQGMILAICRRFQVALEKLEDGRL